MRIPGWLMAGVLCLCAGGAAAWAADGPPIRVSIGAASGVSHFLFGLTFDQSTMPPWGKPQALARAQANLRLLGPVENIHVMGWGTGNPEPSPGQFDWTLLDRHVAEMRAAGAVPVITLCCAPDWMRGGVPGQTDWSQQLKAPTPDHYADFAALAKAVAQRYPDVKHFQVWNELKGFWNRDQNRWDYEGYTQLYNLVYDQLKSVSPDIQVGGPSVAIRLTQSPFAVDRGGIETAYGDVPKRAMDVITYWLAHKHGADFVIVDGGVVNGGPPPANNFIALRYYRDVQQWLKQRTDLPIWWAEWYSAPHQQPDPADPLWHARQNALMTATLIQMAPDTRVALRWGPEQSNQPGKTEPAGQDGLWTSTVRPDGGALLPFGRSAAQFQGCFGDGKSLLATQVTSDAVAALASPACLLTVNQTAQPQTIQALGQIVTLAPYEVKYWTRP